MNGWIIGALIACIVILALVAVALWIERNEWQVQTTAALARLDRARKRHGEERVRWARRQESTIRAFETKNERAVDMMLATFVELQKKDHATMEELAQALLEARVNKGRITMSLAPVTVDYVKAIRREIEATNKENTP